MDGKLDDKLSDLVYARKILKECEMEMEDLSLNVTENVMDQEMEVEDIPRRILDMRSAQQKAARRWDKAEANERKALRTTLDFNNRYSTLVAVVNGTEARKPGNITRTPTCRRHWNYRTSSGTSTCCGWRGRNGGGAGRRTSGDGNLKQNTRRDLTEDARQKKGNQEVRRQRSRRI